MLLALLIPTCLLHSPSIRIEADQSVWVYPHASSPGSDEFLRVWGVDGSSVPDQAGDNEQYSFGYLRFDLATLPKEQPKSALLVLHTCNPANFTLQQIGENPLEARPLSRAFDSKKWTYTDSQSVTPSARKDVFGVAKLVGPFAADHVMELDVDLLKGPISFVEALKAVTDPPPRLYLALTSGISPSGAGSATTAGIYKIYSAATKEKDLRPALLLSY